MNETTDTLLSALTSAAGGSTASKGGSRNAPLRGLVAAPAMPVLGNQPFISVRRGVSALRRLLLPSAVRSVQRSAALSRAACITATLQGVGGLLRSESPPQELPADVADVLEAAHQLAARLKRNTPPAPVLSREQAATVVRAAEQSAAFIRSVLRQPHIAGGLQSTILLIEAGTACYLRSREYADAVSAMHAVAPLARDVLECHASMARVAQATADAAARRNSGTGPRGTPHNPDVVDVHTALAEALSHAPSPVRVTVADVVPAADSTVLGSDSRQLGACSTLWADALSKASQDLDALWTWRDQGLRVRGGSPSKMRGGAPPSTAATSPAPALVDTSTAGASKDVVPVKGGGQAPDAVGGGSIGVSAAAPESRPESEPVEGGSVEKTDKNTEEKSAVNAKAVPVASAVLDDAFDGNSSEEDAGGGSGVHTPPPPEVPRTSGSTKPRARRIPLRMNEPSSRPWLRMDTPQGGATAMHKRTACQTLKKHCHPCSAKSGRRWRRACPLLLLLGAFRLRFVSPLTSVKAFWCTPLGCCFCAS